MNPSRTRGRHSACVMTLVTPWVWLRIHGSTTLATSGCAAKRSCVHVVPDRALPVMKTGGAASPASAAGGAPDGGAAGVKRGGGGGAGGRAGMGEGRGVAPRLDGVDRAARRRDP